MSTQGTVFTRTQGTAAGDMLHLGFGVALFAASLIAIGITCLSRGGIAAVWSGVPKGLPGRAAVITLSAVISIATGLGVLWRRSAVVTARVLLAWMAAWMVAFRIPLVFRAPSATDAWWATGETAAMMAGAWLLYARFARERGEAKPDFLASDNGTQIARVLYGLGLIPFGVAHFTYLQHTADTVPNWLPWHVGWACFTGGTLIAAGVAIVTGVLARLAATLAAWEMTLFTALVWVPIVLRGPDAGQWDEFVDSCVLTGVAWLVVDSYRGMGWLGRGAAFTTPTPSGRIRAFRRKSFHHVAVVNPKETGMRKILLTLAGLSMFVVPAAAQTADEIVAKYVQAIGGMDKIEAIKTLKRSGKFIGAGGFEAVVGQENQRPNMVREEFVIQNLTGVNAYDGRTGWKIEPWEGKKDPEALGEEELKSIVEDADFDGPLVDWKKKGNKLEYLGHDDVEGTDTYKLRVTVANGTVFTYYIDSEYNVPIKIDTKRTIRGTEREYETVVGDYKKVGGVYMPFSFESSAKGSTNASKTVYGKIEANAPINEVRFHKPAPKGLVPRP